jgi:hypothetical protein
MFSNPKIPTCTTFSNPKLTQTLFIYSQSKINLHAYHCADILTSGPQSERRSLERPNAYLFRNYLLIWTTTHRLGVKACPP